MNKYQKWLFPFAIWLLNYAANAQIQPPCPIPPTAVSASVAVDVTYDKASKLYKYKYSVTNARSSQLNIRSFYLSSDEAPKRLAAPLSWDSEYQPESDLQAIYWNSTGTSSNLAIGATKSGFSIQSPRGPGPIKFYVGGAAKIPRAVPTATDDEPNPDCPGFYWVDGRDNRTVVGVTTGPMPSGQVAAFIRVHRAEFADENKAPYLEVNDPGVVHVTLLGSEKFDVSKVDTATISFGPANAKPISVKTIQTDLNDRERRACETLVDGDKDRDRKKKYKGLLLKFAAKDLGIRCNLDHALFITGKIAGNPFFGGAEVSPEKCKAAPVPNPTPGKKKSTKKED